MSDADLARVLDAREIEALHFGYRERVTDLDKPHVRDLPQRLPEAFAAAAARAERAGFDGVELHYAHAYTMAGFMSATNDRDDGFGSSLEGRARLPLDVFQRGPRPRLGPIRRWLPLPHRRNRSRGSRLADAVFFAREFARAGFDFLSLSRGGKFDDAAQPDVGAAVYPYTGESGWECMPTIFADARGPFGRNVADAARVRGAVRDDGFDDAGGRHRRHSRVRAGRSASSRKAPQTSSAPPVRRWPIPTGSSRSNAASAPRSGNVRSRITARRWISGIGK